MTAHDSRRAFRLFMNIAALALFIIALISLALVALSVNAIVSDFQPSLGLTTIWLAGLWAVLSMTAAAWCRVQAMRTDTGSDVSEDDPTTVDVAAVLLQGMASWGTDPAMFEGDPTHSSNQH